MSATQRYSGQVAGTVTDVEVGGNCRFVHIDIGNTTAAVAYLQVFNLPAASVTLGTTAPLLSYRLEASTSKVVAPALPVILGGSGFSVAGTTTRTGSTGAALDINILY